jgi:plastocyanin
MHAFRRYLILLATLLVLSCIAFLLSLAPVPMAVPPTSTEKSLADTIRAGEAPRPDFSTTTQDKLARSKGANALLSYTDLGFEPREVSINEGDVVRFTNNSSRDLWIAAAAATPDERLYPGITNGCGQSELDSCEAIRPQDFWEFRFQAGGTWGVTNILDAVSKAVVHVN